MTPSKRRRSAAVACRAIEPIESSLRAARTLLGHAAEHGLTGEHRWAALEALATARERIEALEERVTWLECDP